MLRALSLLLLVLFAAPAAAQDYQSKGLAEAGVNYRQELVSNVPANKRQPSLIPRLRKDADEEYRAKRHPQAIEDLTRAIAYGADDGLVWLRLAQNLAAAGNDHTMAAAYNAYVKSVDPVERANALFIIGRDYDRHDQLKDALAAFNAGLALTKAPAVAERVEQLKRLVAFRVTKVDIQAEADTPRACLRLNEKIALKADLSYGAVVRSVPALDGIVPARGDTRCLDVLKHGETYQIELLAGFPAASGETMPETFRGRIVVPDRKPAISFAGAGYVLPREGAAGMPVTTINLDRVKVRLVRVNDRNLVPSINAEKLSMSFGSDDVDEVINQAGSLVWQGEMTITGPRNRPVVTAIPLSEMLHDKAPGVYLAAVERADAKDDSRSTPATNWVLVSNLGLTTYTGTDGMAVAVRSLADAKPLKGVALRLYARNNGELGSATTDAEGLARIPGAILRGRGGDEPFAVMAYGAEGDFNFLEIGRAAFDLSDRGVSGRAPPGPVDAYLYTDRGIYRPGESVHLMALVRDDKANSVAGLPVTFRLLRPDGVEVERRQLTGDTLGAHDVTYALARDARIGTWHAELRLDPKAPAIGSIEFRVEDFVPPQLKVELSASDKPVKPGEPYPVAVAARYYYGAPGSGLAVEAQATIGFDEAPFPNEPDFHFGLVGEEFTSDRKDLDPPATDADGKSTATLNLTDLPDLTKPLAATIRVSVFEPSGRAVSESVIRPIRQRPLAIGLRSPAGDEAVPEGQPASLDVIALDADGKRTEAELAIASDRILALRSISLPAGGTTIEVPVDAAWGTGVYALVSAYRPQATAAPGLGPAAPRGPGRAVGVAWLAIDASPRTLSVALAAPDVSRPRGPAEIGIKVAGLAANEDAYVTLAAVDEAVLKLTEFDSPTPEKYYFGKRRLGVELRDLYGRLIDPRASGVGVLRSGGDQFARRSVAGLPDKSSRVVALFSGLVRLDGDGAAKIHFDVPDFQGQLRLMAAAYSARKIGSASGAFTVRDPVVTMVSLPRFLAPGDTAQIGIIVNNVEG